VLYQEVAIMDFSLHGVLRSDRRCYRRGSREICDNAILLCKPTEMSLRRLNANCG